MTLNLQRIKDRLAAYTPGSWAEHRIFRGPEATFVTLVQRDMTALVAEVERLRGAIKAHRGSLDTEDGLVDDSDRKLWAVIEERKDA